MLSTRTLPRSYCPEAIRYRRKTDVRTPLCRAAGNNHTNQLGGTRELSSRLRYKLLPHMSMAAVKQAVVELPTAPPATPPLEGQTTTADGAVL